MVRCKGSKLWHASTTVIGCFAVAAAIAATAESVAGQQLPGNVLKIGNSGGFTSSARDKQQEEGAQQSLSDFIKSQTGFNNVLTQDKSWDSLAQKMSKGEIHVGVFQGYEFAWAKAKYPKLEAIALPINLHRNPVAKIIVRKNKEASIKSFDDLKGKTLTIPANGQPYLRLFIDKLAHEKSTTADKYFSKINTPENLEDALDDVVDGKDVAAVVDQAALDAFKRRKPGRFNQLQEIAHSTPFPPIVIADYNDVLSPETKQTLKDGLMMSHLLEKGQTLLTLFHLTEIVSVPRDFDKVLEETRKNYPPPETKTAVKAER